MATREQLLEIIAGELSAAARSAHEVHTRLIIVQKALLDLPEAVTLDDVTALLAVSHAVVDAEASLLAVAGRLEVPRPIR